MTQPIKRLALLAPALLAGLAACTPAAPPEIEMPTFGTEPDPTTCGADGLQGLLGQPKSVLDTMRFDGPVRIVGPDMAVTMDYNPERLNFGYDRNDRISEVSCG